MRMRSLSQARTSEASELDLNEDQAAFVYALLESRPPRRNRTWKENNNYKAEARKDASWTVCHACGARLSYASKKASTKAKAAAKQAARGTPSMSYGPQRPAASTHLLQGPASSTTSAKIPPQPSIRNEVTVAPELTSALQAMTLGFQEMGTSLRELARGQASMLMMMEKVASRDMTGMNIQQASEMAAQMATETFHMAVDDEEDASPVSPGWDEVGNPNEQDLPTSFRNIAGQDG